MGWAILVLIPIAYGLSASDFTAKAKNFNNNNKSSEDPSNHQSAQSISEIERVNNLTYKSAVNNFPQHDYHSMAGFQRNLMVVLPIMQGISNASSYAKTTVIYTEGTPETLTDLGEQYKDTSKNNLTKKSSRNQTQRKDNFQEWNSETGYLSKSSEDPPRNYGYLKSPNFVRKLNELPKNHRPEYWVSPEADVTTNEVLTDFSPDSTSSPFEVFNSVKSLKINSAKLKSLPATSSLTTEVENATIIPATEEAITKRRYSTRTKKKHNNSRYSVPTPSRSDNKPSKYRNAGTKQPAKPLKEFDQQPYKSGDETTSLSEWESSEQRYSTKSTLSNYSFDGRTSNSNELQDDSGKRSSNESSIPDGISNDSISTYNVPTNVRIKTPSSFDVNQKFTKQLESHSTSSASTLSPTVLADTKSDDNNNLSNSKSNNKSSTIPFEVASKFLPTLIRHDEVLVDISRNQLLSEGVTLKNTSEIGKNSENLTQSVVDFSDVNKSAEVPKDFSIIIRTSTDSNDFSKPLELSNAQTNYSDIFANPEPIKTSTEPNEFSAEPFNSKLNVIYNFLNNSIRNIKLSKLAEPTNFPNIDKLRDDYNAESASFISKPKYAPADDKKVRIKPILFNHENKNIKFPSGDEKRSSNINAFPSDILTPEMQSMLSSMGLDQNDNLFPLSPTTQSPSTTIAGEEAPFETIVSENEPISPQIDPEAYMNFKKIPSFRSEKKYEAKISDDIKQYLVSFGLIPREEKDPKEVILLRMSRGNNDRSRIGRDIARKNLGSGSFPAENKPSSNFHTLPQDVMETLEKLQLPTSFIPEQSKAPRSDHVFSPLVYLEKLNNTDAGMKVNAAIESIRKLSENQNKSNLTIEEIKSRLENITSALSTEELTELAFSNALDNVFNETYDNPDIAPSKINNLPSMVTPAVSLTTKIPYIVNSFSSKKGSSIADSSPTKKLNVIANLPNPLSSEELKQLYENSKNEIKRQQPTEKAQMVPVVLLPNANDTKKVDESNGTSTNLSDVTHPSETLSSTEGTEPLETPGSLASDDSDSKMSSIDEPSSTENTSSAAENASSVATENPSIENTSTVTENTSVTAENTTTVADEVSSTSSRDSSTDDANNSSVSANPPLQELAESFGGGETASEAGSVADLPSPRPNGLYFYVDWNSFLRVGDTNPVDLRFSPKAGNPRNFINITFPYSAY